MLLQIETELRKAGLPPDMFRGIGPRPAFLFGGFAVAVDGIRAAKVVAMGKAGCGHQARLIPSLPSRGEVKDAQVRFAARRGAR